MSVELKSPVEVEGLTVAIPPRLMEKFERAERELRERYGQSPGLSALILMWVGRGSASDVKREFERAVIEIKRINLTPTEEVALDEDCQ
jgi:hypothetical protein